MKLACLLSAALSVSLLTAASAAAAPVVTIGPGNRPSLAVDGAGTGHFVRYDTTGTPERMVYCKLPRGGSVCGGVKEFGAHSPGATDLTRVSRPHVFLPSANQVVVTQERNRPNSIRGDLLASVSVNGGADFGMQNLIASRIPQEGGAREAVFGPGNSITSISEVNQGGAYVQNADFAIEEQGTASLGSSFSAPTSAIGLFDGRPVAVYSDNSDTSSTAPVKLVWRAYDGTGRINDVANWSAPAEIQSTSFSPNIALAGGPNGLFLLYESGSSGSNRLLAARFTGSGFTPGAPVGDVGDLLDIHLTQDAGGRLHAVWDNQGRSRLRWSSSDNGVNWSAPATLNIGSDYTEVRVAAAPDHGGFVTWESGSSVVATALEAIPDGDVDPGLTQDTAKPLLGNVGISDSTLTPGQKATFSFTSNEAGLATLTFAKRVKGLKLRSKGKLRCLVQTKSRLSKLRRSLGKRAKGKKLAAALRKRRCKTLKTVGQIRQRAIAGRNEILFSGRIAGRKLSPGSYRAQLTVADAAGNVSRTATVNFKVIANKKKKKRRSR